MPFLDLVKSILNLEPPKPTLQLVTVNSSDNYSELPFGFFNVEAASRLLHAPRRAQSQAHGALPSEPDRSVRGRTDVARCDWGAPGRPTRCAAGWMQRRALFRPGLTPLTETYAASILRRLVSSASASVISKRRKIAARASSAVEKVAFVSSRLRRSVREPGAPAIASCNVCSPVNRSIGFRR